ncbi:MAG: MgtC/SapB family protein [Candidatus Aenigmarchaeota archaeon]|nr:MgtC/SapB family protein [Candidatus Aenigmarchaeota archaeon]
MISPLEIEIVLKLLLAAGLGLVVGYEREVHRKPAGLRTHSLVCLGSTLFTIVSLSIVGSGVDVSRIAAGVVVGIGFLGAGMIFKSDDNVRGLTTAAELWVLAAIGLAIGIGYYFVAIVGAIIVLVVMIPLKHLSKNARGF